MLSRQVLRAAGPRASSVSRALGGYGSRNYAAAAAQVDSKPSVALFGIDGTYASALYTAAAKTNNLEPIGKALESLHKTFQSDPKLGIVLTAPTLSTEDKASIVKELLKSAGSENETLKNFFKTLSENNRLGALEGVAEKFGLLMGAHRGEVEMRVTSAAPLDAKVLKQLEAAVGKSKLAQGKKLKVVPKVQPDIRGGLIVEVGDRTIDLSVSAKMARMNKLLKDTL